MSQPEWTEAVEDGQQIRTLRHEDTKFDVYRSAYPEESSGPWAVMELAYTETVGAWLPAERTYFDTEAEAIAWAESQVQAGKAG